MNNSSAIDASLLKNFKVLYVEDDDEIMRQIESFLKRKVGAVFTATNGKEGLDAFNSFKPDIVVSDIKMPVMDGIELTSAIKKSPLPHQSYL